jgi:hypothetical protein
MGNRPASVTVISAVTLAFAALALLTFGLLEFNLIYGSLYSNISFISVTAMAVLALETYAVAVSILMFVSDSRIIWYLSMTFWISVIATAVFYSIFLSAGYIEYFILLWTAPPTISSAVCLATFCGTKVRNYYFGLRKERPSPPLPPPWL